MPDFPALCVAPQCRPATVADPEPAPRRTNGQGWLCVVCVDRGRRDLCAIADAWADLEDALQRPEVSRDEQGRAKHGLIEVGLPLNERASEARRKATEHVWFMVRVLDEDRAERGVTLPLPADRSLPGMARWLATWHMDELARMPGGDQLTLEMFRDLADAATAVKRAAYPSGGRRVDTDLPCEEHATSDVGDRVPCGGIMCAWVTPSMARLPDLVCSEDETHRLDPRTWQSRGWRRMHDLLASG